MLKAFLDKLGKTTGVTYTPEEFKKIIEETVAVNSEHIINIIVKENMQEIISNSVKIAVEEAFAQLTTPPAVEETKKEEKSSDKKSK